MSPLLAESLETSCNNATANGALRPLSINANFEVDNEKRRANLVEWLNNLFPNLKLPSEASEEELRACLIDGTVLCGILNCLRPGSLDESQGHFLEKVNKILSYMDEMGLPVFETSDLQKGNMITVVDCLLALKSHFSSDLKGANSTAIDGNQLRKKWKLTEAINLEGINGGDQYACGSPCGSPSPRTTEERRRSSLDMRFQRVLRSSILAESSLLHQVGHKFHEVFQLKQGRYSELPPAKISEMLKSSSLDNAPTQSLLSVVNGILDESMDKKNGEIPYRVACLLRKVVQEIERRISTQAEHIRNQNNLIKARDEKYQSRIRVLETLASGTSEESQVVMNRLHQIKTEKVRTEETNNFGEKDVVKLAKEKENKDIEIFELKKELEITKKMNEERCQQLGAEAKKTQLELEGRLKEAESLLIESGEKNKELETFSESEVRSWSKKEHTYRSFLAFQFEAVQELRGASESVKKDVLNTRKSWQEEFHELGVKLKGVTDAAQNYQTVLAENRKLYNEVQDLKGNIRVYCRIRPFLSNQAAKQSIIEYIGDNGELLVTHPSKKGKEGHRMFKFNKVFGSTASQAEVFLDTQPLIRSVLDGYNVCILAYGQTGSGKTYTMTGPEGASEEDWGVNYRALNDLFHISQNRKNTFMYEVGVQMVEVYNEQVRDLLSDGGSHKNLGILTTSQPDGLAVPDASMHQVSSTSDVLELMQIGHLNRAVSATSLNERSSRSHSVLTVHIRGKDLGSGAALRGSLHLVDLAGSERVDRSEVTGNRLKEAQHINKSLSALGDVIFSLSQKNAHIPYRNSKLTQVLQSSLGGQAKTLMFVQLNPDVDSYSESVSTLKFAERVSGVELGAARSNKEGKDVRELMEQVASLKDVIAKKDEEIEQLQLLKDLGGMPPNGPNEKCVTSSLRHVSSSPSMSSLGRGPANASEKLSGGRAIGSTEKVISDIGNCFEYSDKHSEASSQQSIEDFGHQKELLGLKRLPTTVSGQNSTADVELLGDCNANIDERLSEISDGSISTGTETEGSTCSSEFTFAEGVKSADALDKPNVASRIPRPPQKSRPVAPSRVVSKESAKVTSTKDKKVSPTTEVSKVLSTKDSSKLSPSLKKTSAESSIKSTRKWQ